MYLTFTVRGDIVHIQGEEVHLHIATEAKTYKETSIIMNNIKDYLKRNGVSKQEFANEIKLSRPTLDAYIAAYENGETIPRERYQIIFDDLFDEELEVEVFKEELERVKELLDRDERLGTDKLDTRAADMVSRLKDRMFQDMSQGDWNQSVYTFVDMLITNYRKNVIFEKLAEYFTYLNRSERNDCISDAQIPYFAQFYRVFDSLIKNPASYEYQDFEAFMKRREQLIKDRIIIQEQKEEKFKKLISDAARELEETGIAATDTEILRAVLEKIKN